MMDVIRSMKYYLDRLIQDPNVDGMKALLLDKETTQIISMISSQTDLVENHVYLVETLGSAHERMLHMKAIVFIRPTTKNLLLLKKELKEPQFGEYHIYFSNIMPKGMLETLAEVDVLEVVRQVQEYYADYLVCNRDLFYVFSSQPYERTSTRSRRQDLGHEYDPNHPPPHHHAIISRPRRDARSIEALLALCLSLKKKPVIRYQSGSSRSKHIATQVYQAMNVNTNSNSNSNTNHHHHPGPSRVSRHHHHHQSFSEYSSSTSGLFEFQQREAHQSPVLLILDRREDPVTPLLSQWTYQAMVHELLGLDENRVSTEQELVLSTTSDVFFAKHKNSNFGDLGLAVKALVDEYQVQSTETRRENISSLEELQRFMEHYPAFRVQSLNVSKHVTLMTELATRIEREHLMACSQLEQDLACGDDHTAHALAVSEKLLDWTSSNDAKLRSHAFRLLLLYALRYQSHPANQVDEMLRRHFPESPPRDHHTNHHQLTLTKLLEYAGQNARTHDLYGTKEKHSLTTKVMRAVTQGLKGIPNVYARHSPPLMKHVVELTKGQLSETQFPSCASTKAAAAASSAGVAAREILVFIAGGVTFEEASKVAEWNESSSSGQQHPHASIVLGGTMMLNSRRFLNQVVESTPDEVSVDMSSMFSSSTGSGLGPDFDSI